MTAALLHRVRNALGGRRKTVLVFQMGKVGSRSIVAALNRQRGLDVRHIHHLNPKTLASVGARYRSRGVRLPPHLAESERVWAMIRRGEPLSIVTVVREPIARNVSAFFQNLDLFQAPSDEPLVARVDALIAQFLAEYHHHSCTRWFDLQVRDTLGIDVYQHPFPHDRGYQVVEQQGHRLLILRCESDDATKIAAVNEFLGTRIESLPRVNVGEAKTYSEAYTRFKSLIRFPESYIDDLLVKERFARHFYSAQEIARFRARWTSRPAAPGPATTDAPTTPPA